MYVVKLKETTYIKFNDNVSTARISLWLFSSSTANRLKEYYIFNIFGYNRKLTESIFWVLRKLTIPFNIKTHDHLRFLLSALLIFAALLKTKVSDPVLSNDCKLKEYEGWGWNKAFIYPSYELDWFWAVSYVDCTKLTLGGSSWIPNPWKQLG